jgi:hypothetical protein
MILRNRDQSQERFVNYTGWRYVNFEGSVEGDGTTSGEPASFSLCSPLSWQMPARVLAKCVHSRRLCPLIYPS